MTREEILNRIALKEYNCLFSEIPLIMDRLTVLNMAFNELLRQINLSLGGVMPSLLEEEKLEPIENALYATKHFTVQQCTDLAEGILLYIKDNKYDIVKTNEA